MIRLPIPNPPPGIDPCGGCSTILLAGFGKLIEELTVTALQAKPCGGGVRATFAEVRGVV